MRAPLVIVAFAAGCYQPEVATGLPCADNGACPAGLECRAGTCEQPGAGTDAAPDDVAIDACPAASCSGDELIGCGPSVTCEYGCSDVDGAHCKRLAPSNGVTRALLEGVTADITGEWTFNTESGEIRKGNTTLRAAGPGLIAGIRFAVIEGAGVFAARSFVATGPDDLTPAGSNPLVLFAATTIGISGEVDVGATTQLGVAGGQTALVGTASSGCRGRAGRAHGAGFAEGGGGAGGRTAGADGAPSNVAGATGLGGTLCTTTPSTIPLRGGNGGGAGGASTACSGGGGGGGIALVAMESIAITGRVTAPGAGGESQVTCDAGGGGGGGGAVFLESLQVTVTGFVTAHGGGGGAPRGANGARGYSSSSTPAAGGSFTGPDSVTKTGGRGGAATSAPTVGQNYTYDDGLATPTSVVSRGGGGGGAAGRIEIKSVLHTTPGTISPPATLSAATME